MAKDKIPVTPAILAMKRERVAFALRPYRYEAHGGTRASARELGVDEHQVIKTLARLLGVKAVNPCTPQVAERHTGDHVGGISPFGTKRALRIFMEEGIVSLSLILINAGSRGLLAEMAPAELVRVLKPVTVKVAI